MKNSDHEFAIRKDTRNSRLFSRCLGGFFRIAFLIIALGLYWQWNHGELGVGPILVRERQLATANVTYFVSAFGLLASIALSTLSIASIKHEGKVNG